MTVSHNTRKHKVRFRKAISIIVYLFRRSCSPFKYHNAYICIRRIRISYYPVAYFSTHTCPDYRTEYPTPIISHVYTVIGKPYNPLQIHNGDSCSQPLNCELGFLETCFERCKLNLNSPSLVESLFAQYKRRKVLLRFGH